MVELDGASLTLAQTEAVAVGESVSLSDSARARIAASRQLVADIIARGEVVYGINTGFGALSEMTIPNDELQQLQVNLVRSHACGVGDPLPQPVVRAMLLHRANVLAKGFSGCRPVVVETLLSLLNQGVHPVIPSKGSVGASGDLAPLAHLALVTIGEGEAFFRNERMPGGEALRQAGIAPLQLEAKEGLALLNGTQAMTATGGLALQTALKLTDAADVIGALTLEALRGTPVAFDEKIHAVRPHAGQLTSARRLRALIEHSEIRESHRDKATDPRVQDAYALRCMPQVHGAVRDALNHARSVVEIEINSATDNPLVFAEAQEVLSGGNFHGEPVSLAFDYAAIAIADLATISERRVERLVNPSLSGLPAFLSPHPGTNSGLMIAQVTAASLIAENNVLAHPASVFTLPTSANKEDHVSMGMTAALKLAQIVKNVETVLAIELLCAAQGLEFLKPLKPGPKLAEVYQRVRQRVPALEHDVQLSGYIESLAELVRELA
ncbi:MAG: histidine ammonia-lyase [Acidobacteria bacterium]|nr:histidine ammonia-lyase [Acidobacteriota bacterium]